MSPSYSDTPHHARRWRPPNSSLRAGQDPGSISWDRIRGWRFPSNHSPVAHSQELGPAAQAPPLVQGDSGEGLKPLEEGFVRPIPSEDGRPSRRPVSYTHLTLPTSDL